MTAKIAVHGKEITVGTKGVPASPKLHAYPVGQGRIGDRPLLKVAGQVAGYVAKCFC